MNKYNLGDGSQSIYLTVDTTTHAMAACKAFIVPLDGSSLGIPIAASKDANGDISKTDIGTKDNLNGKVLRIDTLMEMTTLGTNKNIRKKEFENLKGEYTIEGGNDGLKKFGIEQKIHNELYTKFYSRTEIFF